LNQLKTLKTFIVTTFFLISSFGISEGQNTSEFGIMGGLNISDFNNLPDGLTSTSSTGFHFGGFMTFPLSSNFDIQPGIIYTQLGGTMNQSESGQDSVSNGTTSYLANINITQSIKITYGYLQFPVNLVHKFGEGWNVHFGAYLGFLLSDKEHIVQTTSIAIPGYPTQVSDTSGNTNAAVGDNRIEFGLDLGIGYTMNSGLGISFTYSFGFTNIIQAQSGYDPLSGQPITSPAFGSNVLYCFSISYLLR